MPITGINPNAAASAYSNSQSITGQGQVTDITKNIKGLASEIASPGQSEAPSFADFMAKNIQQSVQTMKGGEEMAAKAVTGDADVTDVVQAVTSAELTLQTVVGVRDRMISAYQEIMRMPI